MQRRQNIACDQCRNRKVKCNQLPGEDRCQHCMSKNYSCTHHAQKETEKRRGSTTKRLNRNPTPTNSTLPTVTNAPPSMRSSPPDHGGNHDTREGSELPPVAIPRDRRGSAVVSSSYPTPFLYSGPAPPTSSPFSTHSVPSLAYERQQALPLPYSPPEPATSHARLQDTQYPYPGLPPPPNAPMQEFLAYLFSPDPSMNSLEQVALQSPEVLRAKRKLLEQDYRVDFATELLEVYFQVYHPRVPIVNPAHIRAQFREALIPSLGRDNANLRGDDLSAPFHHSSRESSSTSATNTNLKPIHRPLLATLLAWGSKFSDHALLVLDRQQSHEDLSRSTSISSSSTRSPAPERHGINHSGGRSTQRSNISRLLVDRAREVSEQEKVFRIALPENVVVCMLLEPLQPLQSYPPTDFQGLKCLWLNAGIRHLMEMQVNRHPLNPVSTATHTGDPDEWRCMVFCWWIACIADALCAAYFRRKPALSEDDYDLAELQLASRPRSGTPTSPEQELAVRSQQPSPSVHDSLARGDPPQRWYSALHDLAVCSRYMAQTLWVPGTERDGIPYTVVEITVNMLMRWREEHLATVGASNDLQAHADYVAAVGACASDCSYNVLWIILSQATEDFGIKEVNEGLRRSTPAHVPPNGDETGTSSSSVPMGMPAHLTPMVELERAVANEALKSATRIAGLAGVLTSNGYMRLDPNAIHWPIYSAGRLLARLGREEVFNCIDGLNQNGYAYEESWEHAKELEHAYAVTAASGSGPLDSGSLLHRYLKGTPGMGASPANGRGPTSLTYDSLSVNHEPSDPEIIHQHHFAANFQGLNNNGHPLTYEYSSTTSLRT